MTPEASYSLEGLQRRVRDIASLSFQTDIQHALATLIADLIENLIQEHAEVKYLRSVVNDITVHHGAGVRP